MDNSKLTFKDLDIVEIEDVEKLFEKLSPWDKVKFILTHVDKQNLYKVTSDLFDMMRDSDQNIFLFKKRHNLGD